MTSETVERSGVITFKGNGLTLIGPELKVGDKAPDFQLTSTDLGVSTFESLSDHGTKAVLIIMVPSVDTSVCALETSKFNRQVASIPSEKIKVVTVSADTPFAMKRWATDEGINNIEMLSDHKDRAFASQFGVYIKELGLLARAIFLLDKTGMIRYIQTVAEVATEPDYDAVIKAAREVAAE